MESNALDAPAAANDVVAVRVADLQTLIDRAERRWLTVEGAADYASLSPESIRRMLAQGDLTAHRPRKGRILIDRRQLDNVIESSTKTPRKGRGQGRRTS